MYEKKINIKLLFLLKWIICFFVIILVYFFYWYIHIRNVFNSISYKVPTSIYSRIIHLEPNNFYSRQEVISILFSNGYRCVNYVHSPGEFHIYHNSIDFIRRSFFFPEGKEKSIYVRLTFYKSLLTEIRNLNNDHKLSFIRLDPKLITVIQFSNNKKQLCLSIQKYPNIFVTMLLSIEDRYFFKHEGINFYSIIRAFFVNVIEGRTIQGGSTITQQLVKNLFLDSEKSVWRKTNEGFIALVLNCIYSKKYILELYLNEVYLGQEKNDQIHGFPLASLYYFGCPINELSLEQYALLVGMLKGASLYNPWIRPFEALDRRNLVLYMLFKRHIISNKLYKTLIKRSLNIQDKNKINVSYMVLVQVIKKKLLKHLTNKQKNFSGWTIFTTLDPISQESANQAAQIGIPELKKKMHLKDLEIAMVAIDRFSGEIQAILGGSNPHYLGYNRAYYAKRSIGSLAKPIIYLTALSDPDRYRLSTWLTNKPICLKLNKGNVWIPKNDDNIFSEKIMLIDAFVHSINIPVVSLTMKLGLKKIVNEWKHLGLSQHQVSFIPSISLGSINLTPVEVGQIFQIISSGGNKSKLSLINTIMSTNKRLLYQNFPQSKRIESIEATYLTLYGMQKTVSQGTGKSLGSFFKKFSLAGKTGTTNNLVDSWFVGIDGSQVVVTWIGRDNNHSSKFYGSSGAMEIYKKYLIYKHPKPLLLTCPNTIKFLPINFDGKIVRYDVKSNNVRTLPIWCTLNNDLCNDN